MSKAYYNAIQESMKPIPQNKPENELQVRNNAGGFTFKVSPQARLERFLILGTDGGTYYVSEQDLTKQNMDWLIQNVTLAGDGGLSILETVVEVSESGRAYRNSPAIFVLAILFKYAPPILKAHLIEALPKVCRTATHLFEFANYISMMKAWGRAKRAAVASWYEDKTADEIAYQAVKYRQRNGWTHQGVFRMSHPILGQNNDKQRVGNFIVGKPMSANLDGGGDIIDAFLELQAAKTVTQVLEILEEYRGVPWEAIPTQFLKEPEVWKKLFHNGQLNGQALVRNVTRMARIGAFNDMIFAREYANKLVDPAMIARTRLHPINFLNAYIVYSDGQVQRPKFGSLSWYGHGRKKDWTTTGIVLDALNTGFYEAFKYVQPSEKRTMLALDVSGSMTQFSMGLDLTCAQMAGAMAMSIARSEPYYDIMGFATQFRALNISPSMSLKQVGDEMFSHTMGGTDVAQPMLWAASNKREVDTFVVLTDNETWAGNVHPHVALQQYREKMGIDAKLVVAAFASTGFTIADPRDRGMLDIVGSDASVPRLISEFSQGRI
jgi:60 kDa SS-A/Ro ribonucleoprotein